MSAQTVTQESNQATVVVEKPKKQYVRVSSSISQWIVNGVSRKNFDSESLNYLMGVAYGKILLDERMYGDLAIYFGRPPVSEELRETIFRDIPAELAELGSELYTI